MARLDLEPLAALQSFPWGLPHILHHIKDQIIGFNNCIIIRFKIEGAHNFELLRNNADATQQLHVTKKGFINTPLQTKSTFDYSFYTINVSWSWTQRANSNYIIKDNISIKNEASINTEPAPKPNLEGDDFKHKNGLNTNISNSNGLN